jgi:hypothetical protein
MTTPPTITLARTKNTTQQQDQQKEEAGRSKEHREEDKDNGTDVGPVVPVLLAVIVFSVSP